uniref:Trehalase n=1 Tax=Romanomermis culicivorax TaxID=13658 RepID=A0A915HQV2_ROMCU
IKYEVFLNPDRYSLLYVAHPFIVPGGRFREFYYWDSYWIMKGLLYSEMYSTAKGIMRNFADLIQSGSTRFGFVPNGGRVYYLLRSQPPLLTLMVYDFYLETGDIDFVCEMLPALIDEYTFWKSQRSTMFQDSTLLYQYKVDMKMPRPESYREDVEVARNLTSEEDRYKMWSNIASAAETGWDFSSRWFSHEGVLANRLASIRTQHISPVDLNAFMCLNALLLTKLLEIEGYHSRDQQMKFLSHYEDLKAMVELLHWNESAGVWFDYDLERRTHIDTYYVSNALPLFTRCYDNDTKPRRVYEYMRRVGAFDTSKGIPTSFIESAQQWDSSNVWPPMVHMLIIGFRTSNDQSLVEFARLLAEQWLRSSYNAFEVSKNMFEKYNSASGGLGGGGGEYDVQTGFGWTNGVILDLLAKYGHVASYKEPELSSPIAKLVEPQPLMPAAQTEATTSSPTVPLTAATPLTQATSAGLTLLSSTERPAPEKVVEPIDDTKTGRTEYLLPPEKETELKMVDQEQRDFLAEQLQRKGSVMLSELLDEDDF